MGLFTNSAGHSYSVQQMPAPERQAGPWGEAIAYWLKERKLRQADLVKATKIEAKTISRIARGFHTQTRKLELIAKYLLVPLEHVLVSPLRSGPSEDRRQLVRGIIEDALHAIDIGEGRLDQADQELARRIHQLPSDLHDSVVDLVGQYERVAKKRRRSGESTKHTKKRKPSTA